MFRRQVFQYGARQRLTDRLDVRQNPFRVAFFVVKRDLDQNGGRVRVRRFVKRFAGAEVAVRLFDAAVRAVVKRQNFVDDALGEAFAFAAETEAKRFGSASALVGGVRVNGEIEVDVAGVRFGDVIAEPFFRVVAINDDADAYEERLASAKNSDPG